MCCDLLTVSKQNKSRVKQLTPEPSRKYINLHLNILGTYW